MSERQPFDHSADDDAEVDFLQGDLAPHSNLRGVDAPRSTLEGLTECNTPAYKYGRVRK